MLLSSCATLRIPAFLMLSPLGCTGKNCSPFSNQLKDTDRAHNACMHTPCRPQFPNQKPDSNGHKRREEVGKQRRVTVIELIFGAV